MRTALILCLVLLAPGCALFESGTKATLSIAWDAAEEIVRAKVPIITAEAAAYAKAEAMKVVDKAATEIERETVRQCEVVVDKAKAAWGVDVREVQNMGELMRRIDEEQRRRKSQGEDPLPWYATPGLLAALATWQVGKSAKRALDAKGKPKP